MPPPQVPRDPTLPWSPRAICRKAGWRETGVLYRGRARREQQAGLPAMQEIHCLSLPRAAQDTAGPAQLGALVQLVMCWHHWWRCPGLLASPVSPALSGLCRDKPPWTEPHESARSDLARKESFHLGIICLLWLQSSLVCLQCCSLHQ